MEESLKELFQRHFKEPVKSISPVKSHASDRQLFRLTGEKHVVIGAINDDHKENRAFLGFSRHFRKNNLPVPEIYIEDLEKGIYLEEDLGDVTLFDFLSKNRQGGAISTKVLEYYNQAVKVLPKFQMTAGKTLDYRLCYPRASFDKQSMMWDLNYFKYYFLRLGHIPFNEQALENDFKHFAQYLLAAPRNFFLYRDFQSRNIMLKEGRTWFIDYQGGRKGALQYDVASLLYDAKADLPPDVRSEILRRYLEAAKSVISLDRAKFMEYFPGFVYIRIMQAMGTYGLRGFYDRKPLFLQSIPYAVRNIEYLLRTTALPVAVPELLRVFKRLVASSSLRQYGNADLKLTVRIQSFSYRNGIPADTHGHGGGFVFDCRSLPNPGKFARYSKMTGKDPQVIAFLKKESAVTQFLANVDRIVDHSVEDYQKRNFTDLLVAFGCTGGQHRSVYCAEVLAAHLRKKFDINIEVSHLEQDARTQ